MKIILSFIAGLCLWTFIEYLIHGILSHRYKTPVSTMHWQHHREPRRVFTSPLAPIIIVPLLWWVFSFVIGNGLAAVLMLGTLSGFALYEHVHWRIHFREPKSQWMKRLKAHHLAHHFCNARMYHGVTNHFWDRVFNTLNTPELRREHYARSADIPPMQGESNFSEVYSLNGWKIIRDTFRKSSSR